MIDPSAFEVQDNAAPEMMDGIKRAKWCQHGLSRELRGRACYRSPEMVCRYCARAMCAAHRDSNCRVRKGLAPFGRFGHRSG